MKFKVLLIISFLLIISACTNNDNESSNNQESFQETEDMETLIATNKKLVEQLEKELDEKDQFNKRIKDLEEENKQLKDDVLTYKQQAIESDEEHQQELELRNELDQSARELFQYMHERNHTELERLTASNIYVQEENDVLEVTDEEDNIRTFHYMQLNNMAYIRQRSFSLDMSQETFVTEYEFYTHADDTFLFEGAIELVYTDEEGWKLSSIRYIQ
jgi:hypothetical protein